jgi:hypothetical protein
VTPNLELIRDSASGRLRRILRWASSLTHGCHETRRRRKNSAAGRNKLHRGRNIAASGSRKSSCWPRKSGCVCPLPAPGAIVYPVRDCKRLGDARKRNPSTHCVSEYVLYVLLKECWFAGQTRERPAGAAATLAAPAPAGTFSRSK